MLCVSQSTRCLAAYVYSASGPEAHDSPGWAGTIHELGALLAQTERFPSKSQMAVADSTSSAAAGSMRTVTFNAAAAAAGHPEKSVAASLEHAPSFEDIGLERTDRFPFVPTIRGASTGLLRAFISMCTPTKRIQAPTASAS